MNGILILYKLEDAKNPIKRGVSHSTSIGKHFCIDSESMVHMTWTLLK